MSNKGNENPKPSNAKVLQLGFNISVTGNPTTDFQIVLDDKQTPQNQLPSSGILPIQNSTEEQMIKEVEDKQHEVNLAQKTGATPKTRESGDQNNVTPETSKTTEDENSSESSHKETNIINEIKSTMEHFEKFSDHIKEIPRLKNRPLATSTPFADRPPSKSEASLIYPEYRPRRFAHLYDWQTKKEYFKGTVKPLPPDLFLKPLPAEDYYKRGIVTRYFDLEPYRHYSSAETLNKIESVPTKVNKYEPEVAVETPPGILKKSDSESGDKLSTSSADSVKDIKIYQSGGILIMQNFKDTDIVNKKEISDFSAKLIENCNRLKEEVNAGFPIIEDRPGGNSSDELKNSGKMVQFDLSELENPKSKSGDSLSNYLKDESSGKMESSESTDLAKNKDSSPQETFQSQDFASLSTQENDSVVSNQPGTSPTFGTSDKKLEWDSGADVGYLNLDLSKENLSTIERIVLKGLSSDGLSEKKVVYEKKPEQSHTNLSKFILERMPSESIIEEVDENKNEAPSEKQIDKANSSKSEEQKEMQMERKTKENAEESPKEKESSVSVEERPITEKGVKEISRSEESPKNKKLSRKVVESTDKSVNVNTLFKDSECQAKSFRTEDYRLIESPSKFKSSRQSPKVKKLKKKRPPSQRTNVTAPLREKIDSIIDIARHSSRDNQNVVEMGVPKRVYRKVEANPELQEVELSREMEEIIIDQRFKIKQNLSVSRDGKNITENVENKKEVRKCRPISASSSSNNTVLPNTEDLGKKKTKPNKFTDQIIQTNEFKMESVGVQAFSSQKSSDCDVKSVAMETLPEVTKPEGVNTSSKNIQAFGLNSSLPKQLSHPKESEVINNQNTKSTQFFGGSINSLPNYHANIITKPVESCGRMPKVLKAKKNLEPEIICLREENVKNIMGDAKNSELKRDSKKRENDIENKENLISEKSVSSKKSHVSKKGSKGNDGHVGSQETKDSTKCSKNEASIEASECSQKKEDVSSQVLTSEVLREYGDSIDRNIIQEKYFQSQLIEIEKREMISKSTSMERQSEKNISGKEKVTVACQYSPQSRDNVSEGESKSPDNSINDKKIKNSKEMEPSEQYDSSQNLLEEERFGTLKSTNHEQDFATGDSLPSSTQTAHSWIPGMRESDQNKKSGVGRARSFEYLPGHIYESSGNLREELPSDTEPNVITCTSSGSSFSRGGKNSLSNGRKDSEGRTTLVLENSTENSHESGPMKSLDENLTHLNMVVSKLWEKDAQIQSITQSLLVNLWKNNGSGDGFRNLGARESPKTETITKDTSNGRNGGKDSGDSPPSVNLVGKKTNEISIGCQTEEKSSVSDPERYFEERKSLEMRISQEKQSQIKWIENEIYHLNILRGLLEKQNNSSQRRKKHSPFSTVLNGSKTEDSCKQDFLADVHSRPVTPVYGLTISLSEKKSANPCKRIMEVRKAVFSEEEETNLDEGVKYGVAFSLTGAAKNLQSSVAFPVGVQVCMDNKSPEEDFDDNLEQCSSRRQSRQSSLKSHSPERQIDYSSRQSSPRSRSLEKQIRHQRSSQADMGVQFPSLKRASENDPSTSVQTDFRSPIRCGTCKHENCVCLDLSGKSYESTSHSSRNSRKYSDKKASPRLNSENEDCKTHSTDTEFVDLESYPVSKTYKSFERCGENRSYSTGSFARNRGTQMTRCKCDNCPRNITSKGSKPGMPAHDPCQSNVYLNCESPAKEVGWCRCSKMQVQKSSTSTCHIIKILGSKCCSSERGTCSCKRRNPVKETEDQSCQTDDVKDFADSSELGIPTKGSGVICPTKDRRSIEKKFLSQPKVSDEEIYPCSPRIEVRKKVALERTTDEDDEVAVKATTPEPVCNCRKKPKVDDHPRHYFLKIEEREVDDSNESVEPRKSLEVITVTVPVKKAGKAKIYESISKPDIAESFNDYPAKGCNCCDGCINRCQKMPRQYDNYQSDPYQSIQTEKTNYSKRIDGSQPTEEYDSCEDFDNRSGRNRGGQSNSSVDCYPEKLVSEYPRSQPYYYDKPGNEGTKLQGCDFYKRKVQPTWFRDNRNVYSSHKEGRSYQEDRKQQSSGKLYESSYRENGSKSGGTLPKYNSEYERYSGDYYNYNKKEFMTQSELMRERDKKSRTHQPSLQECLASNRPDFYNNAESRRQMISERIKERVKKHNNRLECLMNLIHQCNESESSRNAVQNASENQSKFYTSIDNRRRSMANSKY